MKTNKIVSLVVVLVLLAATVAGAFLGIFGRNTQYVTVRENGEDVERALYRQVAFIPNTINENWQEAIRPSAALGGGYSYTLTAEQGDMSAADFNKALSSAAKIAKARVELLTGSADAKVQDGKIVLTTNEGAYNSAIGMVLSNVGNITLNFYNTETGEFGEAVLDASHVKQSYYGANQTAALTGGASYQLQLQLTKKGEKAYNTLVKDHAGESIYLVMDGGMAASAYVTSLTDGVLNMNCDSSDTAFLAVSALRSGVLPVALTLESDGLAEATMGGFLNGAITGFAVALLLCCIYLIAVARLGGVVGAWMLAAQLVIFWLIAAIISINAGWTMNLASLIALLVAEALFVFGLVAIVCGMAASIRKGLGAHAALKAAYKQSTKLLLVVYGALLAIGLVLMFAFTATLYGVLGRLLALSAVVSVVMLLGVLRVVMNCVFTGITSKSALYGAAK